MYFYLSDGVCEASTEPSFNDSQTTTLRLKKRKEGRKGGSFNEVFKSLSISFLVLTPTRTKAFFCTLSLAFLTQKCPDVDERVA